MFTVKDIRESINDIVVNYPIKKISLFGSYADGSANEDSDIDLLVEFLSSNVSLFMLFDIKDEIENKLQKQVDLIHAPIDENTLIKINKVINIYEQ
ncbi:nucleotidyltransferase domain-containing protein [Alkalibaculum sp. M08DMB]|uniref:Nucleotidyltransferase domain-containing protein n=1 Tax=Alkalibaculum sporogenes TaxID=2655001 RepID=A0A6A7K9P9_9FIRM|nr:nucleotidyltransferase domain-containing protein [Alkalibaculum sporogenes]MPW26154.1 nucleotidyltransferase domain-containing protein [Alkalibaculum sporogenes]